MKEWFNKYPNILMWVVLAVGMNGILIFEAQDVGLNGSQWFWLLVITTLVAGACVWIISWGDDEEFEEEA
ncbi:MAG: hypothetical protein AAGD96_12970 [Chloroflexota bacterium]